MRTSAVYIIAIAVTTATILIPTRVVRRHANTITMVTWGMPFEDALFQDGYARGFEGRNPGWTVEYQRHTVVNDKYNAWHVQRRGADVMRIGIDYYHGYVEKGMLTPLSSFIRDPDIGLSEDEIADYFPQIWSQLQIEGDMYALPSDNAQYGLYYNRTIFDAYNESHPADPIAYPDASWTWRDLKDASERLTLQDEHGRTEQFGVLFDLWAWPFLAFLHQAGGHEWDDEQTTTLIDSPEGVDALSFLVSVVPEDAPMRVAEMAASAASPAELFKTGRLAMLLDGSWRAPNIELDAPDLDFAIAPLPRGRKPAVVSGSVLWGVSAHSPNKGKAWEMIRWMTNREQSLRYWDALRVAPPARLSVVQSDAFRSTTGIVDGGQVRVPAMPRSFYGVRAAWLEYAVTPHPETGERPGFVPAAPYQADLQNAIAVALRDATRGDATPAGALAKAAADVHRIIDRDRAARGLPPVERESP